MTNSPTIVQTVATITALRERLAYLHSERDRLNAEVAALAPAIAEARDLLDAALFDANITTVPPKRGNL